VKQQSYHTFPYLKYFGLKVNYLLTKVFSHRVVSSSNITTTPAFCIHCLSL
jgi:hypothetical protein